MALDQEELRRRLVSARELVGLDQRQMGLKLEAEGLGRTDAMRLERGAIAFSRSHRAAYERLTGLPAEWFEAEAVSVLFDSAPISDPVQVAADAVEAAEAAARAARRDDPPSSPVDMPPDDQATGRRLGGG